MLSGPQRLFLAPLRRPFPRAAGCDLSVSSSTSGRGSRPLGWTLRDLRRHRTEGRRAQERLARLELKWARDPGLTAGVLVDRVLAGAYGEAAEVAGTLMTPVRGADGSGWAAGWLAARELITLRLLALADEARPPAAEPGPVSRATR
ncbi:hypothetical protein NJO91_29660 [Streptomyces microflavus]|uniref:hypothetical protein n=1 Tax=Streptomyces microflavus TaxID=1919 RepID=UPI0029BC4334|nr:hypothetical protein [Streptomyces microflavus]MDX2407281.1 hypothetical protein [Streptomyces microflavus]